MTCYRRPQAGDILADDCPDCGHFIMAHSRSEKPGGCCPLCALDRLLTQLEELAAR